MTSAEIPVVIVGGGPAGLFMALFLVKNGISVRILDKESAFHTGSRGFGIQPRTFELMKFLGILDDVQKLAVPIPTMRAYKLPGGTVPVKTWDLYEKSGVLWPDRPYANGACLSQAVLEGIIRDHLQRYHVAVELRQELTAIEESEHHVVAHFHDHQTDKTYDIKAKYLIGADGAKGVTRKLLGLTFEGQTRDTDGMVWGDVEIQGLGSDYWHIWGKPGHFTIMARLLSPDSTEFGVGITGLDFDPSHLADEEEAKKFIHEGTGRNDLRFGKFSWLSYFKPKMRMVNKFSEGRVFIVGDAAHVHSPTGGQGMNTATQDSANLAWKLALVLRGLSSPDLLSSYNTERLPVVAQMLHATSALYTHVVREVKDGGIPTQKPDEDEKQSGWFRWRNSALEMYGINYRYSPMIVEERYTSPQSEEDMKARAYEGYEGLGTLRAGDRAPEAPGLVLDGAETSLFALFQPSKHTVLFFVPDKQTAVDGILEVAGACPEGTVQTFVVSKDSGTLIDRDGHAFSSYRVVKGINVVVVRPDGFIGCIVASEAGLKLYFEGIFS
ncbi:FAD binding domain-containing protein [Roridomyces roridus]|uniref:FAD binding domain-containing protein n=1 Tax=Roridomyces roridus TaxID=1738132 RepID=A0AAD7FXA3_9AGAR|nr:FAD binding domain-containing protein [Roridomyces roridus]